jgi:hypothetical protein
MVKRSVAVALYECTTSQLVHSLDVLLQSSHIEPEHFVQTTQSGQQ